MRWRIAYRNLFRNRRRTLATSVAIMAGFVGLTLLGGYILRVQNSLKANSVYLNHHGHLSIYKKDGLQKFAVRPSRYQITVEEKERLYALLQKYQDQIEFTGEILSGSGLISNGEKSLPFLATGFDPEVESRILSHPIVLKWAGDFLAGSTGSFPDEARKNPLTISITSRLGEYLGRETPFSTLNEEQRSVQLAGRSFQNDLNAVNAELMVSHTTGSQMSEDTSLWAPLKMLQDLYGTDGIHYLALYLKNESSLQRLKDSLEKDFAREGLPLEVYSYDNEAVSPAYVGSMGFLRTMSGFFVFLICGAVALSIVNSLTMGIFERTKELGTLRALGFETEDICQLFAREACLLAVLSMVVGGIVSALVSVTINAMNIRFVAPGLAADAQLVLAPSAWWVTAIAFALLTIAVLTGYLTSKLKMKARVIELLSDAGA